MDDARAIELMERSLEQANSKPVKLTDKISAKREELELKKLEMEIAKLSAPQTNVDYVKQMLDLQQANFNQLIQMQQKQHETDLKLAKMESGGEDGNDWIMDLLPMLPEILKARTATAQQPVAPQVAQQNATPPPFASIEKEGSKLKIPNAAEIELYKKKIRAGEITAEEFYNDAVASYPDIAKKVSKETIVAEYEKIKSTVV